MKNNKSLGQHWLKNRMILDYIADEAVNGECEICLEIGPGLGTLTSSLLKRFKKVIAVEFDQNLAQNLPKSFPGKNLEVINADFLKFDLNQMSKAYCAAGNIPYYITSPIIEKLLTAENQPQKIVLLMQKEVADRIASEKETVLSLFVKNHAMVELGDIVYKAEFTPPPKVDSRVLILTPKTPEVKAEVFTLIKRGFSAPRKKLAANLAGLKSKDELKNIFAKINIDENARPADLHLKDWQNLFDNML